jgi:carboxyl-terminal processing protease
MIAPRLAFKGKLLVITAMLFSLSFGLTAAYGFKEIGNYEYNRARLLSYMLRQFLLTHHFSHKKIDDDLSRASFDFYLKQLDVQKRFLLKEDVNRLKFYSDLIDDEINTGKMKLPEISINIFTKRAEKVQQSIKEILSNDFDFSKQEFIETDTEKLDYSRTEEELRERWRKILKHEVLHHYLDLMEDSTNHTKAVKKTPEQKIGSPVSRQESSRKKILNKYENFFSKIQQIKTNEHYDRYFNSITRAFDPHTRYMPPTYKEDFDIHMKGSLEGIGATLSEAEGYIKVVRIVPGGPAFSQGQLHAEDIILHVGEGDSEKVDITHMRLRDAVRLIRGKKGTEVRLTVKKPDGIRIVIPIIRDVVQLEESFVKGTTLKVKKNDRAFGYVKLPTFYRDFKSTMKGGTGRNSTDDIIKELKKFESQNISGLILDLRNNTGGALTDSVNIAGLFIETGPVVQVKDNNGEISVLSDKNPDIFYTGPIIVLVNKLSASASEILAGALQDCTSGLRPCSNHRGRTYTRQRNSSIDS